MENLLQFFLVETDILEPDLNTGTVFREQHAQIQHQINEPRSQGGKRNAHNTQTQSTYKQEGGNDFDGTAGEGSSHQPLRITGGTKEGG